MPLIALSWDLALVVLFAVTMSAGFIIGKNRLMKVIIAAYVSIIAIQGIGGVLMRLTGSGPTLLQTMGVPMDPTLLSLGKIFLFALCVGIFIVRSGIEVSHAKNTGSVLTIAYTALLGFSLAGIISSTILSYAIGSESTSSGVLAPAPIGPLLAQSTLAQVLILNQDLWYALPAFLIIVIGFLRDNE